MKWHTDPQVHAMFVEKLASRGISVTIADSGFYDHHRRFGFFIHVPGRGDLTEHIEKTAASLPSEQEVEEIVERFASRLEL